MAGKTVKLYELCTSDSSQLWSPFVWRTKLACWHKGLKVETVPWRFTEKDRIKFANSDKVPVLVNGDKSVKESFDIAVYLEETFPDAPSLFDGKGGQATARFIDNYANEAIGKYFAVLLPDIWKALDKKDADYFRESREEAFGAKLEDAAKNPDDQIKAFREYLEPLRQTLGQQAFVGGDKPSYGDYCLASIILSGKALKDLQLFEKDDPVSDWLKRLLSKFEGDLKGSTWKGSVL